MKMIEKNLPENMKIRVHHQHLDNGRLDNTIAVVYDVNSGETLGVGRAFVNHRKEKSPNRKIGRAIAVGRAMSAALRQKRTSVLKTLIKNVDKEKEEHYIDWEAFARSAY